jgi:16S rRNA (uracil1498-N3)-methyltransferase
MPTFYSNRFSGQEALLDEEESRHLVRVLRLKAGDPVEVVDGLGNMYKGTIARADQGGTRIRIQETARDHLLRPFHLHIAIAPTKSPDRFEWFLEKATEIGIEEITPILCQRSERKSVRHDRSTRILLSAMKQSGRALLPKLNPIIPFEDFTLQAVADNKFIAHCRSRPGSLPADPGAGNLSWLVLVGPEGDFTPAEVRMAVDRDYREINLGEAVYRTETAGIMACQLVRFLHMER